MPTEIKKIIELEKKGIPVFTRVPFEDSTIGMRVSYQNLYEAVRVADNGESIEVDIKSEDIDGEIITIATLVSFPTRPF